LAVDDLNAAGGIDGRLIELLSRDDEQNIALSRTRLQELFDSGVVWVVGIGFSNALFSPRTPPGTPPAELSDTHPRGCWARHQPVEH